MKTIMDGPSWRVVSDGTGAGTKVYAPDGSDVSETVRAVRLELGPHQPGRAPIFYGTLELLNVAVDVAVKGPLVRRFAYCKEHRELREVDEENRHLPRIPDGQPSSDHIPLRIAPVAAGEAWREGENFVWVHREQAEEALAALEVSGKEGLLKWLATEVRHVRRTAEPAAALREAKGSVHRCDGCRQYLPCEAVTGRGWRCEGCRG